MYCGALLYPVSIGGHSDWIRSQVTDTCDWFLVVLDCWKIFVYWKTYTGPVLVPWYELGTVCNDFDRVCVLFLSGGICGCSCHDILCIHDGFPCENCIQVETG